MPRILCFLHSFEPGGVERTALHLCAAWREAGAEVAVLLGRDEGRMRCEGAGLDYLVPPRPGFSTAPIETLWMMFWLPWTILRWQPDVLFCAGNSYTIVAVAMKLLLGRRCPPIVAKISNDLVRIDLPGPIRRVYRLWCRLQGKWLDHLVALSPAMRGEIINVMGVEPGRVAVVEDAVLEESALPMLAQASRRALATRGIGRRLVAAGRLAAQKDFGLMISAFARAAKPADRLVILGEGPERPRLERLIDRLELGKRVRLVGHQDRIAPWLGCSDVLLLSSRYEGLPAIVIEALAAGLPVIATDCCVSMAGLLDDGRLGIPVAPGDERAFGEAIATLRPEAYDSAAAIAFAARFTVQAAASSYLDLFARLANEPLEHARGLVMAREPA